MAGSITSTALNGAKSALRFIEGSWAKSVGEAYRAAHVADPTKIGVTTFNWGKAYCDYFDKAAQVAAEAASKPAAKGFWASIKNGLGKIPGLKFVGRNFGPIIMFGPMVISAVKELFNGGGIGGALKELTKGTIGWVGWSLGTMIACACGATGIVVPFLAAMVVSSVAGWIATKALGPSTAEKQEALIAQQKQMQEQMQLQGNGNPNFNINDITRDVRQLEYMFNNRNNGYQTSNYTTSPYGNCFIA